MEYIFHGKYYNNLNFPLFLRLKFFNNKFIGNNNFVLMLTWKNLRG